MSLPVCARFEYTECRRGKIVADQVLVGEAYWILDVDIYNNSDNSTGMAVEDSVGRGRAGRNSLIDASNGLQEAQLPQRQRASAIVTSFKDLSRSLMYQWKACMILLGGHLVSKFIEIL